MGHSLGCVCGGEAPSWIFIPNPCFHLFVPAFPALSLHFTLLYPCFHPFIPASPPTCLLSLPHPPFPTSSQLSLPHPCFHSFIPTPSSIFSPHLCLLMEGFAFIANKSRKRWLMEQLPTVPPVLLWLEFVPHSMLSHGSWLQLPGCCLPQLPLPCVLFPTLQARGYAVPVSLQPSWLLLRDHGHICLPKFPAWGRPPGGGR